MLNLHRCQLEVILRNGQLGAEVPKKWCVNCRHYWGAQWEVICSTGHYWCAQLEVMCSTGHYWGAQQEVRCSTGSYVLNGKVCAQLEIIGVLNAKVFWVLHGKLMVCIL